MQMPVIQTFFHSLADHLRDSVPLVRDNASSLRSEVRRLKILEASQAAIGT